MRPLQQQQQQQQQTLLLCFVHGFKVRFGSFCFSLSVSPFSLLVCFGLDWSGWLLLSIRLVSFRFAFVVTLGREWEEMELGRAVVAACEVGGGNQMSSCFISLYVEENLHALGLSRHS